MTRSLLAGVVIVLGCKHTSNEQAPPPPPTPTVAPAPAPAPTGPKTARLVATLERNAQLVDITGATAKVSATVQLPQAPQDVVWAGKDPIALFANSGIPDGRDDPALDGTVGTITAAGFTKLSPLPASAWSIAKPPGATHLGPFWKLGAADNGETWLGRCEWGGIEDGGHCDDWVWARLGGPFQLTSRKPPPELATPAMPKIAAPAGYSVTFTPHADSKHESVLTCSGGGKTLTFPSKPEDNAVDADSLRWVSADPPIFVVNQIVNGFVPHAEMMAFEGCAVSEKYGGEPGAIAGPDGLLALASGKSLSIRRDGKELSALAGADHVRFAPDAAPATTSSLAILERQLAGDTSMFTADAIVLAPAPVAAAGVQLVPPGIRTVRISTFQSGDSGSAEWFAAELEITTDGKPRIYRALELVDKTGKVAVASFAPLKPLARVAAAPSVPSSTDAGPLATYLTDTRAAGVALATGGQVAVFGTDPGERATDVDAAQKLLGSWSTLGLALEPHAREVHWPRGGYAVAIVNYAKPGGPPFRMAALVIGSEDKGVWLVSAYHYLSL